MLTACGSVGTKTINNIPSELVIVEDRPEPPKGDFKQAEFGEYGKQLDDGLKQCNADKEAIKDWIEQIQ